MKINLIGKENVFEQIVNEYKKYIELDVYRHNEKLPSCRELAKQLGVNPNTVSKAYIKLEEIGYIKTLPKKGAYVTFMKENDSKQNKIKETIMELKNNKITYNELLNVINEVYKEEK